MIRTAIPAVQPRACPAAHIERSAGRLPSKLVSGGAARGDRGGGQDHEAPLAVLHAANVSGSLPRRARPRLVARAISGHVTIEMLQLYSSVDGSEVRSGLAKISLAGFRHAREAQENGGDRGGDRLSEASSDDDLRKGSGDAEEVGGDRGGDRTERSLTVQ